MEIQKSSMQPPKRSRRRRLTPSTQRTWTPTEESTLINGLKALCVNGRRADNGTFRPGYLMELEHYLREHHPENGLKGEPHVNYELKFWKRCYASLSLLKGRSGLGFQYSDGTIIIDDPKEWDKFLKGKQHETKKWPLFANWEEIFGKDRATGEHAEGPLDVVEDILKSQTSGLSTDMSLGFLINVDDDEYEDEASHGPNAPTEEAKNTDTWHNFTQTTENEYARVFPREHSGPSEKQGEYAKTSSSSVNEKEKGKKRKRVAEDVNKTFLKSMAEVMKNFTESQDKRIGSLIDKIGNRDHPDMRGQIYSIIETPTFDLYTIEQRIKAKKVICEDVKNMEIFLRMGELERQTMMFMVINDKL
uniref:RNase H family protein n=1 Tax=Solanum tuberosum TaxID=4113 RepID=M1A806_SOLTU